MPQGAAAVALWTCLIASEIVMTLVGVVAIGMIRSNEEWDKFDFAPSPAPNQTASDVSLAVNVLVMSLVSVLLNVVLAILPWLLHGCFVPWHGGRNNSTGALWATCCQGCCCGALGLEPLCCCACCATCTHPCGACPTCCCCSQKEEDEFFRSAPADPVAPTPAQEYAELPLFMQELHWTPAFMLHLNLLMCLVQFCWFVWLLQMRPEVRMSLSVVWIMGIQIVNCLIGRTTWRSWRLKYDLWPLLRASQAIASAEPWFHDTTVLSKLGHAYFERMEQLAWSEEVHQLCLIDWLHAVRGVNVRVAPSTLYAFATQTHAISTTISLTDNLSDGVTQSVNMTGLSARSSIASEQEAQEYKARDRPLSYRPSMFMAFSSLPLESKESKRPIVSRHPCESKYLMELAINHDRAADVAAAVQRQGRVELVTPGYSSQTMMDMV
jgi:hypothetical protein